MKTNFNFLIKLCVLTFLLISLNGFTQNLVWAKQFAGADSSSSSTDSPKSVVDENGNLYVTDVFKGTFDFDPGPAVFNLTSAGDFDISICKLDVNGNFIWAKRIGSSSLDSSHSIELDGANNVYISGAFSESVDFDPGIGVYNLSSFSVAGWNGFICKLNANGDFIWAKNFESSFSNTISNMSVNNDGKIFITGAFRGTVDFDPSSNNALLSSDGTQRDIYIGSYDSFGNLIWIYRIGGNNEEIVSNIVHDGFSNIYLAIAFLGTVDLNPGPDVLNLTDGPNPGGDWCFLKLNTTGDLMFAKQFSAYYSLRSIAVDSSGNIYHSGSFSGTVDFDPGPGIFDLSASGNGDMLVSKLDSSGNFSWAKSFGSVDPTSSESILDMKIDPFDNVFLTGYFGGTVDFDTGVGVYNLSAFLGTGGFNDVDAFISKLDASGSFVWARKTGVNSGEDIGRSIAVDKIGNVYFSGTFRGGAFDFDPNAGTFNLTVQGFRDSFSCKLSGGNTIALVGTATESGNFETDYVMTTSDQVNYTLTNIFLSTTGTLQSTPGEVKFRMNGNWTVNWGGTTFPSGTGVQGGSNIPVTTSGFYNVTLNALTGAYTFTYLGAPPTISMIGSNIGTAWTTDLNLSSTNGRNYVLNNITLVQGQAKFRQNGGWLINWGNTAFPSGVGFQDGPNIPITAGTYDIAFNRYTGAYSFSPSLNSIDFNANFNEFFLYPNPAQNSVTIKSENYSLGAIKVSDVLGKTIFETTTSDNELILDCSYYPIGLYFITSKREGQFITKKLVVDK